MFSLSLPRPVPFTVSLYRRLFVTTSPRDIKATYWCLIPCPSTYVALSLGDRRRTNKRQDKEGLVCTRPPTIKRLPCSLHSLPSFPLLLSFFFFPNPFPIFFPTAKQLPLRRPLVVMPGERVLGEIAILLPFPPLHRSVTSLQSERSAAAV